MKRMLASHVAGFRLVWLVVLLSIPAGLMGWELIAQALTQRAALESSSKGPELLALVSPIIIDEMSGAVPNEHIKALETQGAEMAANAGVQLEFSKLVYSLDNSPEDSRSVLQVASRLAAAIGNGAARNNGGDREANALINLETMILPQLALNYRTQLLDAEACISEGPGTCAQLLNIILATAATEFQSRQLGTGVINARSMSDNFQAYDRLLNTTYTLTFHAAQMRTVLLASNAQNAPDVAKLQELLREGRAAWKDNLRNTWLDINARLRDVLTKRREEVNAWLLKSAVVSIAAIVLGVGAAISLFNSTLQKLDELQEARAQARAAQAEAERTSADLVSLNEGMTHINAELAENLKALKAAQDQLVRKTRMEQMGQLTATIAHELRNPLGAVRTSIFLLERKTKNANLGIEGQILRINNGIARCDDIITQLLDFSRSKHIVAAPENLDRWLENTIAEEAQRLPPDLTINCDFGLNGLKVPFDPTRLHRAVCNLVNNASEAMIEKAPEGELALRPPAIWIATRQEGAYAMVAVRDNGCGIPASNLAKIREPLFTTKSFGTGLGLPAVEQILVQHGGTLEIESEEGTGSCFTMKLPLNQVVEQAA